MYRKNNRKKRNNISRIFVPILIIALFAGLCILGPKVPFIQNVLSFPYKTINNNVPEFSDDEILEKGQIQLSNLDNFGRCGPAVACLGPENLTQKERGDIWMVKPSGWHSVQYPGIIEDEYLYNRCHLLAHMLTGLDAEPKNLVTGTRFLNVEGMLPFENRVAEYIRKTGNHVLYSVYPEFIGNELLCRGIYMKGKSLEDNGKGLHFSVYCYNIQPGIDINYKTGDSKEKESGFWKLLSTIRRVR